MECTSCGECITKNMKYCEVCGGPIEKPEVEEILELNPYSKYPRIPNYRTVYNPNHENDLTLRSQREKEWKETCKTCEFAQDYEEDDFMGLYSEVKCKKYLYHISSHLGRSTCDSWVKKLDDLVHIDKLYWKKLPIKNKNPSTLKKILKWNKKYSTIDSDSGFTICCIIFVIVLIFSRVV